MKRNTPKESNQRRSRVRKAVQHQLPLYGGVLSSSRSDIVFDRIFYGALIGSILMHIFFVLFSTTLRVNDIQKIESEIETLFKAAAGAGIVLARIDSLRSS